MCVILRVGFNARAEHCIAILQGLLSACRGTEVPGYGYEGRLRGLHEPVKAGFANQAPGASAPRIQ